MQKPKRTMIALSCLLLLAVPALLSGCGKPLVYPMGAEGPQPVAVRDFGDLDLMPDTFKGRAVMMAGRIVGTEIEGQGVVITAEWLPMPKDMRKGPSEEEARRDRQFIVHYPAGIDSEGLWNGNKFVAVGRIHEAAPGGRLAVPDVDASCVHIWKTRELSITETLYKDELLFPVPEQTYCRKS
jgi:starvation-inducible outer membrane lipoprotein